MKVVIKVLILLMSIQLTGSAPAADLSERLAWLAAKEQTTALPGNNIFRMLCSTKLMDFCFFCLKLGFTRVRV